MTVALEVLNSLRAARAFAAGILFYREEYPDTVLITIVILCNAIIGTYQEGKAAKALAALKELSTSSATVIRNQQEVILPDYQLVPGDIIIMKEGRKGARRRAYSQRATINY